jgi:mannose-6-phosphate isomerase-like protein (cupin superfamily)
VDAKGEDMIIKHAEVEPIEFDGLHILDYTADQDISSSIAEIVVPIGTHHRLSWSNRSDKYYYVVRGKLSFTVNDEIRDLSSGDVCIVPKGKRFQYKNIGSGEAVLILVHTPNFKLECEEFEDEYV